MAEAPEKSVAKSKEEKLTKRPSAKKRDLQNEKRRQRNRSCRSEVMTAIRSLTASVEKKESAEITKQKLDLIYSLVDKNVKKGVFTKNKAARTKSRLASRIKA